jgi:hypothetical protein
MDNVINNVREICCSLLWHTTLFALHLSLIASLSSLFPLISSPLLIAQPAVQLYTSPEMALPGTETVRFRRPIDPSAPAPKAKEEKDEFGKLVPRWKKRHLGLLQDLVGR